MSGAIHASDLAHIYARKIDARKATFVICQECFWCASCFRVYDSFLRCPLCTNDSIDSLPIFGDEYYKVELSANGNVKLRFAASHDADGP